MESQTHGAREESVDEPFGNAKPGDGLQQTRAGADGRVLEKVFPEHGDRPAGHDVGEYEDGGYKFFIGEIRAGDEPRDDPAEQHGDRTGQQRHQHRLPQRRPELGPGVVILFAGQQFHPMIEGEFAVFFAEVTPFLDGIDLE